MLYHSTRSEAHFVDSAEAVLEGLAPDGGLYMPESIPAFDWRACLRGSSTEMSAKILAALLPDMFAPAEVDRLQQILFYRALDLPLAEIRTLLERPDFDRQAALQSHDCEELVQLIKTVYAKSRRHGRRVSQVDQRYRKRAEELLNSELSVALGIPLKEVPAYINQRIGKLGKKTAKKTAE